MIRRFIFSLGLGVFLLGGAFSTLDSTTRQAIAQNITCPTRAITDNSNACASTAWVRNYINSLFPGTFRERLTAARDYYVRASGGSDSNCSGLVNVADPGTGTVPRACAYATLQKASNVVYNDLDRASYNVTIGITGTFSTGVVFVGPGVGSGTVTVYTPTTASIGVASQDAFVARDGAYVTFLGANITISTATSGICIWAYNNGAITINGGIFGAGASGHIAAGAAGGGYGPGNIYIVGSYSVLGNASSHIHIISEGSSVLQSPSATITFVGSPTFSSFVVGLTKGLYYAQTATPFTNAAVGQQFYIHNGGNIVTLLPKALFPGSITGIIASGGVYNDSSVLNDNSTLGVEAITGLNTAAPSSPASGYTTGYFDSTHKRFHDKNDAGSIGTTVVADTGASNNFLTAISSAGAISKAQPTLSNISGYGTGVLTALGTNVGSAGGPVTFNGAGGTPSSLTLTNATGLPIAGGGTGNTSTVAEIARVQNGFIFASTTNVNFNSANTDSAITITLPSGYTRFIVNRIYISHASASLTTSTFGVFSATGGGGYAIQAAGTANTVNTASDATANNSMLSAAGSNQTSFVATSLATPNTIYFRVGTPQGSAATADVTVYYIPVP